MRALGLTERSAKRFGDVVVLGLGKSGTAAARWLLDAHEQDPQLVSSVTVYPAGATQSAADTVAELAAAGAVIVPDSQEVTGSFDLAVASPGISEFSDFFLSAKACSDQVITEPELAWRVSPGGWVGITGTNGKTTTTSLATHVLNQCGMPARSVGNIGDTCIEAVRDRKPGEVLVAELSSFQLASMPTFAPDAAVLLNITPDHIEWHRTLEAYAQAKCRIFDNIGADGLAVVDACDPGSAAVAPALQQRGVPVVRVGAGEQGAFADNVDGTLVVRLPGAQEPVALCAADDLAIKGDHNVRNALAAAAVALHLGLAPADVARALCSFSPIEHRIEPVETVDGVFYCNDSKATNTDATVKALTAFGDRPLIVLLGGHDKMTDLGDLVEACAARCKAVVCYGEARERFAAAFRDAGAQERCQVIEAPHMAEALAAARAAAQPGDAVALSPACSSFDEFTSYGERGNVFKRLVREMDGERS